ncbi:hypothetical protein C5B42_05605 [Candidatus Cerribacteria bacterium 'Amazon FNV 2010 28 9']|uniref:Uncharacterized protein n=1 Tax=Candidatus Cerribacteria bacterium 'Amazon FNV 2010 28 9' TaxID=2081795 RepID=A0A317JR63_9BACT|nr:MAG: hypothetical protein C5B42_05605 [Candidatus Cerribacteria bacterium 'Amazon FNV 2010 28 9']
MIGFLIALLGAVMMGLAKYEIQFVVGLGLVVIGIFVIISNLYPTEPKPLPTPVPVVIVTSTPTPSATADAFR